jgi:hypothetical protein
MLKSKRVARHAILSESRAVIHFNLGRTQLPARIAVRSVLFANLNPHLRKATANEKNYGSAKEGEENGSLDGERASRHCRLCRPSWR